MRSARPLALALLLSLVGNSGGIVGLITARLGRSRAAFRLGLATLKILPQRGAQTPPLPHPVCALGTNVHGDKLRNRRCSTEGLRRTDAPFAGACLRHFRPYGKDRRARGRVPFLLFSPPARRCRSSVVEHPLGKGEVVSSILTGSTSRLHGHLRPDGDALITSQPSWSLLRSPRPLRSRTAATDPR